MSASLNLHMKTLWTDARPRQQICSQENPRKRPALIPDGGKGSRHPRRAEINLSFQKELRCFCWAAGGGGGRNREPELLSPDWTRRRHVGNTPITANQNAARLPAQQGRNVHGQRKEALRELGACACTCVHMAVHERQQGGF